MKETRKRVRSSVQRACIQCPGLSCDQCLVEDAIANRYDQRLVAFVYWDADGVAAESVGKYPVVGD